MEVYLNIRPVEIMGIDIPTGTEWKKLEDGYYHPEGRASEYAVDHEFIESAYRDFVKADPKTLKQDKISMKAKVIESEVKALIEELEQQNVQNLDALIRQQKKHLEAIEILKNT